MDRDNGIKKASNRAKAHPYGSVNHCTVFGHYLNENNKTQRMMDACTNAMLNSPFDEKSVRSMETAMPCNETNPNSKSLPSQPS